MGFAECLTLSYYTYAFRAALSRTEIWCTGKCLSNTPEGEDFVGFGMENFMIMILYALKIIKVNIQVLFS